MRRGLSTLVLVPVAHAHFPATAATAVTASVARPCPGDPLRPDHLITGAFEASLQGGYVPVPFDVPAGTTAVRVKHCFDQPEAPMPDIRHALDLGVRDPRGFRGWVARATRTLVHGQPHLHAEHSAGRRDDEADVRLRLPRGRPRLPHAHDYVTSYGLRLRRGQFTEAVGTAIWFRKAKGGRVVVRGC